MHCTQSGRTRKLNWKCVRRVNDGKTAAACDVCAFSKLRRAECGVRTHIYIHGMMKYVQTKGHSGGDGKRGKCSKMTTLLASTGRHWASPSFPIHNSTSVIFWFILDSSGTFVPNETKNGENENEKIGKSVSWVIGSMATSFPFSRRRYSRLRCAR